MRGAKREGERENEIQEGGVEEQGRDGFISTAECFSSPLWGSRIDS